ncbi:tyrosine-type recombinase/integrase [Candidatus Skiveiella danica]|uniref:tyrosine-type recombinase/integrase n=1 Tax=Candidatus Skiveiella danica TaxID=3386177 RepID=UPI0039B83209
MGAGRHAKRNQLLLQMAHYAGFRVGELAALRVSDVLAADGTIVDQLTLLPEQTKGDRHRVVFLPAKLRQCIADYLAAQNEAVAVPEPEGGEIHRKHLTGDDDSDLCEGRLPGCSSHSGRRSFLTKLAARGSVCVVLQELAGHRHLTTTQRYIDVNDDMKRSALMLI